MALKSSPKQALASKKSLGVPGARVALVLLLAINLFNYVDRYVLAAVEDQIQHDFGSTAAQTGLLATAFLVSYMCFAPLFGWLADRYSRWMLVGVGVLLWSAASGATGLATGIGMMLATRVFVGIGEAAYGPVAPTIISDLYPIERRGQVLAWFYVAMPVGSALGYMLGGQVLHLGFTWHYAFFIVVPPGLLLGFWALAMRDSRRDQVAAMKLSPNSSLPTASPSNETTKPKATALADYKQLLRIPSYLYNTAGMTAMTFAVGGLAFWIPRYLVWRKVHAGLLDPANAELRRAALTDANWTFGVIVVVTGLAATLSGGWLGDKLRNRWPGSYFLVSGYGMLFALPFFLAALVVPFPAAWALIFITCCGLFFNTGPSNTILANVTHPSIRAAGFALNIFIIHTLGDAISPPLIGKINMVFGDHAAQVSQAGVAALASAGGKADELVSTNMNAGFATVSLAIFLSGVFWVLGSKHLARDTAKITAAEQAAI
ncbi:MAG TPA: MFS transporter [Pirellulales bacterium]|nr:MFS transporter [Pirellulales bacterium]